MQQQPVGTKEDVTLCVAEGVHTKEHMKDVYLCVYVLSFKYYKCRHIVYLGCIVCILKGNVCAKRVAESSTFAFAVSALMSFSNGSTRPNVSLEQPLKHGIYVCVHTRVHVTPCVNSLLINAEVLKALSADLIT